MVFMNLSVYKCMLCPISLQSNQNNSTYTLIYFKKQQIVNKGIIKIMQHFFFSIILKSKKNFVYLCENYRNIRKKNLLS